jgi:hypothetical protein
MSAPHPLERIAALERERDGLRERLALHERGDEHAAYKKERDRLDDELAGLRRENEDLRGRLPAARKARRFTGPVWQILGSLLRRDDE